MMEHSIRIRNLGKRYKLYASRRDRLKDWLIPFGTEHRYEEKWVLQDINLDIAPGEAVGLVGMNGAGKSTLLKIVTGTTIPTTGTVELSGKVSALLELGLGFHPDFTGRQNVYMSGQLLGYTSREIDECMNAIEDFAEIGAAIDEPVRTYSSGMQVRLAFSVATMKHPDILIVDEALSVGDAYFQHKSFGRIQEFCKAGTTLLLVSHDAAAIQAVCERAVLLDHGQVKKIGKPQEIMDYYNAMLSNPDCDNIALQISKTGQVQTVSGTGEVTAVKVFITDEHMEEKEVFGVGEEVVIHVSAQCHKDVEQLVCGFMIKNKLGEVIYGTNTYYHKQILHNVKKGEIIEFSFAMALNLGEGSYSINSALVDSNTHLSRNYEWKELGTVFEVINYGKPIFTGMNYLETKVEIKRG